MNIVNIVKFVSVKGGQGVTTVACAYAIRKASEGLTVHLIGTDDTVAALGLPPIDPRTASTDVAPRLTFGHGVATYAGLDLLVIDGEHSILGTTFLVMRPCYLALRRFMDRPVDADGFVLVNEIGRALGEQDIAVCLGLPCVARVDHDPAVARTIDAGLFLSRPPRALGASLTSIAELDRHTGEGD